MRISRNLATAAALLTCKDLYSAICVQVSHKDLALNLTHLHRPAWAGAALHTEYMNTTVSHSKTTCMPSDGGF